MTIFSRIIAGEIPSYKVAEDENFYAFLDINPLAVGHTLVAPKKEVDYIFDLDDETMAAMILFSKKVAKAIEKAIPCQRVGLTVIGLEVPHAHIHLVPINKESDMYFGSQRSKLSPEVFQETANSIAEKFISDEQEPHKNKSKGLLTTAFVMAFFLISFVFSAKVQAQYQSGYAGWSFNEGRLPGLFGKAVRMPQYLRVEFEIPSNKVKSAEEYIDGSIVFHSDETRTGQLTDADALTIDDGNKVILKKKFEAGKWYAVGFPFNIASVYGEGYEGGRALKNGGDYYLKFYNSSSNTFEYYAEGATTISAGGYILQVPNALNGLTLVFTSEEEVSLSNPDGITDYETGAYKHISNPSVANLNVSYNPIGNFYYAYGHLKPNHFDLIGNGENHDLKPFESLIIANGIPEDNLLAAMATSIPTLKASGERVIATEYYTLQGTRITRPVKGNIYLVKQIFESGNTNVVKEIIK